jgi:hypothetical protein
MNFIGAAECDSCSEKVHGARTMLLRPNVKSKIETRADTLTSRLVTLRVLEMSQSG